MTTIADAYKQLGEVVKLTSLLFGRIAEDDAAQPEVQLRVDTAREAVKALQAMIGATDSQVENFRVSCCFRG